MAPLPIWKQFAAVARSPVVTVILLRLLEFFGSWLARQRRLRLDKRRLQTSCLKSLELDAELLQGCLMSTEHLMTLGRIEKRTIFSRPLLEVLGGNQHLQQEIIRAADECRSKSRNCIVARWMPGDERYHVLQSGLNAMSALFGPEYLHFNALGGQNPTAFKPTWYVLTVTTWIRPKSPPSSPRRGGRAVSKEYSEAMTATFQDMTRRPRAALRILLVNESELRRIADGKLGPPEWGFFNSRHHERFRMVQDLAQLFQKQLVRSTCDASALDHRSPFTNEHVHKARSHHRRADGGAFKRVNSVPVAMSEGDLGRLGKDLSADDRRHRRRTRRHTQSDAEASQPEGDGGCDENCFLRINVPLPNMSLLDSRCLSRRQAHTDDSSDELTAAVQGSVW